MQALVLTVIAVGITVGVYGTVAGIVRMDDAGIYLLNKTHNAAKILGRFLLWGAPKLMKFLSVFGTVAMFLVGGGILIHGAPFATEGVHHLEQWVGHMPLLALTLPAIVTGVLGFMAGLMIVVVVEGIYTLKRFF